MALVVSAALLAGGAATASASGPVAVAPENLTTVVAPSETSPVSFSLGIGSGYLAGEATELVYWPQADNHVASELTWDIDSLFMFGVDGSLRFAERFAINVEAWFKATNGDGTMDDYDWQIVGGPWTDWSHHEDVEVTDGSIFDISGQYAVIHKPGLQLNLIAGYRRDNFGWEARGGSYIYSGNGFRDTAGAFPSGLLGISYEQTMSSFYLGLGGDVQMGNFRLDGRVIYSPWVQGEATDYHHLRNLVVYDDFEDGDLLAIDVAGSYYFTPSLALEAGVKIQNYDTMQGDSEWHYNDSGRIVSVADGAGMDHSSSMLTLTLRYTF